MNCSVIIPAYNASETIRATLDSVLPNLSEDDEVLVVNDGSTDDTPSVCEGIDARIKVISITNCGPAKARNHGIEQASGKYIAFCDADDLWLPGKLDQQLECFASNPGIALCFTDYQIIDTQDNILTSSAIEDRDLPLTHTLVSMLKTNPVATSSAVALCSALREIGGFPDTFNHQLQVHLAGEDYETWIAIAERHPVAMVPKVLTSYRQIPQGMFLQSVDNRAAAKEKLIRRVEFIKRIAKNNPSTIEPKQIRKALSEICFRGAYSERTNGFHMSGAALLIKSLLNDPFRLKAYVNLALIPVHTILWQKKTMRP